ncbi:MAG: putative regulatory protein, ArsR family [Chloroflexota bacterium]
MEFTAALTARAAAHAALGEPLRLAIVEALALTDLAPSEVEAALAVPSNLLAHHLRTLEAAGLIERRVSAGDHRRRYLVLTEAGRAMLPERGAPLEADRVLFVCTANSARSPLAEALWRRSGAAVGVASAGTHPAPEVHPLARATAERAGLDLDHAPAELGAVARPGDLVVTVCDQAHEERGAPPADLHWSVPDPAAGGRPEDFEAALHRLEARVSTLAQHVRPRTRHRVPQAGE